MAKDTKILFPRPKYDCNLYKEEGPVILDDPYPDLRVTSDTVIEDEEFWLKVNGTEVCSMGSISLVTGKNKSRKTTFVVAIIASALAGKEMMGISAQLPVSKNKILLIDTEQTRYETKSMIRKIIEMSGLSDVEANKRLLVYNLRKFSSVERIQCVEFVMQYTRGYGLVVIDGIRDMVVDINSPEEATVVSSWLLKESDERGFHILNVLHQNKSKDDKNARGHIGSELANKAQYIFEVELSGPYSSVKGHGRQKDFQQFYFGHDESSLPALVDVLPRERGKRCTKPEELPENEKKEMLAKAFASDKMMKYGELVARIKSVARIGDNRGKALIKHFNDDGYIEKTGKGEYFIPEGSADEGAD